MIKLIESLRVSNKVSRSRLSGICNVSKATYYRYLNGASVPCEVLMRVVDHFGYKIQLVRKESDDVV